MGLPSRARHHTIALRHATFVRRGGHEILGLGLLLVAAWSMTTAVGHGTVAKCGDHRLRLSAAVSGRACSALSTDV